MISQALVATSLFALTSSVAAGPVAKRASALPARQFGGFNFGSASFSQSSAVSFNDFHGISSLDGFDNFYGVDNFSGLRNIHTVVEEQSSELVCHSVSVEIIQQQLAVIQEYVKKIITQQICEVETQTVVFSQFSSSLFSFGDDIRHVSGRQVSFDDTIARKIVSIHDSTGEIVSNNLGFSGSSVGSDSVVPTGYNWNDATSPSSVGEAYSAAQSAAIASGGTVPDTSDSSSDPTSTASAPPTDSTDSTDSSSTDAPSASSTDTSDASTTDDTSSAAAPAATDSTDSSSDHENPADD